MLAPLVDFTHCDAYSPPAPGQGRDVSRGSSARRCIVRGAWLRRRRRRALRRCRRGGCVASVPATRRGRSMAPGPTPAPAAMQRHVAPSPRSRASPSPPAPRRRRGPSSAGSTRCSVVSGPAKQHRGSAGAAQAIVGVGRERHTGEAAGDDQLDVDARRQVGGVSRAGAALRHARRPQHRIGQRLETRVEQHPRRRVGVLVLADGDARLPLQRRVLAAGERERQHRVAGESWRSHAGASSQSHCVRLSVSVSVGAGPR